MFLTAIKRVKGRLDTKSSKAKVKVDPLPNMGHASWGWEL